MWNVVGSIVAVAAVWFLWTNIDDPIVPVLVGVVAWGGLLGLLTRLSSPRPGQILVWMSPAGLGQQAAVDPNSWAGRLTRAWPLMALTLGSTMLVFSRTAKLNAGATTQFFLMPAVAALAWWGRPRPAVPGDGLRPPLYAWSSFADIDFSPVGDRYRLVGRHDNWFARRQRTVAIELTLPPDVATALRDRIAAFRQKR